MTSENGLDENPSGHSCTVTSRATPSGKFGLRGLSPSPSTSAGLDWMKFPDPQTGELTDSRIIKCSTPGCENPVTMTRISKTPRCVACKKAHARAYDREYKRDHRPPRLRYAPGEPKPIRRRGGNLELGGTWFVEFDPGPFPLSRGPFSSSEIKCGLARHSFYPGTILRTGDRWYQVTGTVTLRRKRIEGDDLMVAKNKIKSECPICRGDFYATKQSGQVCSSHQDWYVTRCANCGKNCFSRWARLCMNCRSQNGNGQK